MTTESERAELLACLRAMPSSLNDACRTMESAATEIEFLSAPVEQACEVVQPVAWQWGCAGTWYTVESHEVENPEQYARSLSHQVRAIYTTPQPAPGFAEGLLRSVMDQVESDLKSAHAEICKLQGLDPATHDWPEWSPQATTLRWFATMRNRITASRPTVDPERKP